MNIENNVPYFKVGDTAVYLLDEVGRNPSDLDAFISNFRNVRGFDVAFNNYVDNLKLVGE